MTDEQKQALAKDIGRALGGIIAYRIYRCLGANKWQAYAITDIALRLDRLRDR